MYKGNSSMLNPIRLAEGESKVNTYQTALRIFENTTYLAEGESKVKSLATPMLATT